MNSKETHFTNGVSKAHSESFFSNKIKKNNLLKMLTSLSLLSLSLITTITLCLSNSIPSQAGEIEMFVGDEMLYVDSSGAGYRQAPSKITPDDFNPVIQPRAAVHSNKVSKMFQTMRERKGKKFNLFSSDNFLTSKNTELPTYLLDSLRRPQVAVSLNQLNARGNSRLQVAKKRLQYYQPLFEKIFTEEGVPSELISIGFVESTYNPLALSPAGARGIWQFIPSTGRSYGLNSQDDFADPVKSTRAAAKYLKKLYGRFGDWLLAVAAYNAGDSRVQQAINMSNGNKDFWEVSRFLPNETRNYVPRVLAATAVIKSGNSFGGNID